MTTIGIAAELFGTRMALVTSSMVGMVALGVIALRSRRSLLGVDPSRSGLQS
jgi:hypothetical protein